MTDITFAAWSADWMARQAPALRPLSRETYASQLAHLLARFGERPMASLTRQDGIDCQLALIERGLSDGTVAAILRLGRTIVADWLPDGAANPWARVRQKRGVRMPRLVLEAHDWQAVADRVASPTLRELILLAIATGCRRGELLALRWSDVRLDEAPALVITGSLEQRQDGSIHRKAPKTPAGFRTVRLPAVAAAMLRARRVGAGVAALAAGRPLDDAPVFAHRNGGWRRPDTVSEAVRRAMRAAGHAESLHGARHAHVTALLSSGMNPRAVAGRAGHQSVKTTMEVYAHALPRDDEQAVAILDDKLAAANG